jgi:hypothetical protein
MKTTLRGVLSLTLALGLLVTTTGAFGSDSTIYPLHDDHVVLDVSNGRTASILLIWDAKTKGQVEMFIDSEETRYSLRDDTTGTVIWELNPIEADRYWSTPYKVTADFGNLECKKDYLWEALFSAPLPDLEAGHHYSLTVEFFNRHPVNDGFHMCGYEHFNFPVIGWTSVITIDAV